jgi:hypothetical protein
MFLYSNTTTRRDQLHYSFLPPLLGYIITSIFFFPLSQISEEPRHPHSTDRNRQQTSTDPRRPTRELRRWAGCISCIDPRRGPSPCSGGKADMNRRRSDRGVRRDITSQRACWKRKRALADQRNSERVCGCAVGGVETVRAAVGVGEPVGGAVVADAARVCIGMSIYLLV